MATAKNTARGKTTPKTVTLAQNIRFQGILLKAGESYPVGTGDGEIDPSWLKHLPLLDLEHPDNQRSMERRAALLAKANQKAQPRPAGQSDRPRLPGDAPRVGLA